MTQRAITMATITEDYVSFETAKLLKKKGFDELCYACYEYFESVVTLFEGWTFEYKGEPVHNTNDEIKCPTLQMVTKWLREVHNLNIEVFYFNPDKDNLWAFEVIKLPLGGTLYGEYDKEKYEEAVEVALKYCLENLI